MVGRTLTDLDYGSEGIPLHGRCSKCGQLFLTPTNAMFDSEKATYDFYTTFAVHECLATTPGRRHRSLVILRYRDRVPILASCSACHCKFFTISALLGNARKAEQYLLERFDLHECSGDVSSSSTTQN